jgi:hypothetical protein
MASAIECLPIELLDLLIGQLGYTELAHLVRCSKQLHHRIEPILYASHKALDNAMFWARKNGKLLTIRQAVLYGADVSIVNAPTSEFPEEFPISTLHLAARKGYVDAFALLLELGARIDQNMKVNQFKCLLRNLSTNKLLLDLLLKAGLGSQLRERPDLRISLVSVIKSGGSMDVVRQFLDNGADERQHESVGVVGFETPLTAAISVNSASLFDFLIERGADIDGDDVIEGFYPVEPLHIPVFAAARSMEKHGLEMMQRCLDLGADISQRYYRPNTFLYYRFGDSNNPTNTLLVCLYSIKSWKAPMKLRPVDGVAYLLKHLDSKVAFETYRPNPSSPSRTLLDVLLDKWGLGKLADPEFFATISLLIENGASKYQTERIIRKYDNQIHNRGGVGYTLPDDTVRAWALFVDLLRKHANMPRTRCLRDNCDCRWGLLDG